MLENIVISLIVTIVVSFPLSIYAGVIVARYSAFDGTINQARSIILNLEQEWVFAYLPEKIPDPKSSTGKRAIYTSEALSGNTLFWKLMQVGLSLKEQGHWPAATVVDGVAMELDSLRDEIVQKAEFAVGETVFDATAHIADWHRRLSRARPNTFLILKPWPNKRYEHLSCVSVNEETGEWSEEEPSTPIL